MGGLFVVVALMTLAGLTQAARITVDYSLPHHEMPSPPQGGGVDFDFYIMATFWPPELCHSEATQDCVKPQPYWENHLTAHGLWPNNINGTWPQACTHEAFDPSVVDPMFDALFTYWPNLQYDHNSQKYDDFWQHEWSKHGTCTGLSQTQYFQTGLDLIQDITPTSLTNMVGATLNVSTILEAFGGEEMAVLLCSGGKYFQGAYTCWVKGEDHYPVKRMACPSAVLAEHTCPSSPSSLVVLPAFK